jgi:putative hydrolase of the HAD superfamily
MMTLQAITFDFWRTLFHDPTPPLRRRAIRAEALAHAAGVSVDQAVDALRQTEHAFLTHHINEQRTLGPADALRMVCEDLCVSIDEGKQTELTRVFAEAILEDPPVPIPGALEAVEAAAARVPVGVVSDSGISPGSSLRQLLHLHGFTKHLGALAFSDEVGVAKPQALMFHTAAEGLSVSPSGLLHIGDLELTDIAGAKAVGARAALFAGDNRRYVENTTADYTFTAWSEFVAALPEIP